MTTFLVLLILVLVAFSIWQIAKLSSLTNNRRNTDITEVANDKDNRINAKIMVAFMIFLYFIMFLGFWKWGRFVLGTPASEHGLEYDFLFNITFLIIFIVQFVIQFLLHYFAYKYAGKKGLRAIYFADSNKLEAIWTIIPIIVLAALILYGLWTWTKITNITDEDNPLIIELYAQQFNWTARYAGDDNVLGESNVRFLTDLGGKNITGIDITDPNGMDDIIVKGEFHLPVNRKVIFKMRSQDVLHSAYMPHFRAQMNCVPGMVTQFAFVPTVTTKEMRKDKGIIAQVEEINEIRRIETENGNEKEPWEFDYILLCNKICGTSHYNMQMKIVVETEEEFNKWLAQQQKFGELVISN